MSLLSTLAAASTALQVFSTALGADQTNVSNSSTPGFAAIRANISPIGSSGPGLSSPDFVEFQSTGSPHLDARVQSAASQSSYTQTTADRLGPINQLFDITGSGGILASLQQFATAFSSVSITPNDTALRSAALSAAGTVALAFRKAAASLDSQKNAVDAGIQSTVLSINKLAGQIRQFNVAVRSQPQPDPATDAGLRSALDQLSALTDITVSKNPDGTLSVLTGGQQPLVLGDQAYSLSADPTAPPGSQVSSTGGGAPAGYSGQLGALLDLRNGPLQTLTGAAGGFSGQLNDLAKGFASRVNALLASGVAPDGTPGGALFTFDPVTDSNVARTLSISSTATPDSLALASTGSASQSNGIAAQLASLPSSGQSADQISGLSADALFARIASGIGQQLSDSRNSASTDASALTTAQSDRQAVSGVSLDQEAVSITAYQRSYEASAKIVSILDQLTSDEVNLIK